MEIVTGENKLYSNWIFLNLGDITEDKNLYIDLYYISNDDLQGVELALEETLQCQLNCFKMLEMNSFKNEESTSILSILTDNTYRKPLQEVISNISEEKCIKCPNYNKCHLSNDNVRNKIFGYIEDLRELVED